MNLEALKTIDESFTQGRKYEIMRGEYSRAIKVLSRKAHENDLVVIDDQRRQHRLAGKYLINNFKLN